MPTRVVLPCSCWLRSTGFSVWRARRSRTRNRGADNRDNQRSLVANVRLDSARTRYVGELAQHSEIKSALWVCFAAWRTVPIQFLTAHAAVQMMISFSLFIWGCHDWLIPEDLAPLPSNLRRLLFRVDACFFLMTVNPPLLRCIRVRRPRAGSTPTRRRQPEG